MSHKIKKVFKSILNILFVPAIIVVGLIMILYDMLSY